MAPMSGTDSGTPRSSRSSRDLDSGATAPRTAGPSALQALIFDFDGLIVDTETEDFACWVALYEEHGLSLSFDAWLVGVGTIGAFDPLAAFTWMSPAERAALHERKRAMLRTRLEQGSPRPGIVRLLDEAAHAGLKLAIASSSPSVWVDGWLTHHDLRRYFPILCTHDDVDAVKPDPALYRLALHRLSLSAADAAALEDSLHGATAARRAGLPCFVYPNSITTSMPFPPECHRLDSLDGGLAALLSRLG